MRFTFGASLCTHDILAMEQTSLLHFPPNRGAHLHRPILGWDAFTRHMIGAASLTQQAAHLSSTCMPAQHVQGLKRRRKQSIQLDLKWLSMCLTEYCIHWEMVVNAEAEAPTGSTFELVETYRAIPLLPQVACQM
jgi:hypothetical protein